MYGCIFSSVSSISSFIVSIVLILAPFVLISLFYVESEFVVLSGAESDFDFNLF